jgi:hypothetical protein
VSLASKGSPPDTHRGPLCDTCRVLRELSEEDAATIAEWFTRPNNVNVNQWISEQLDAEGYRVGPSSLERHRRGGCRRVSI